MYYSWNKYCLYPFGYGLRTKFPEFQKDFIILYIILGLYTNAVWILNVEACLQLAKVSTFHVSCKVVCEPGFQSPKIEQ